MTHPTIEQREDGGAVEEMARADDAAPELVAIQHRYEEARACIVDPARSGSYPEPGCGDAHPPTEEIDVRTVKPPVGHDATPPTEAMSVAAKFLAERQVGEEAGSPAGAGAPRPRQPRTDRPVPAPGPSRWWRAIRRALDGGVKGARPGS